MGAWAYIMDRCTEEKKKNICTYIPLFACPTMDMAKNKNAAIVLRDRAIDTCNPYRKKPMTDTASSTKHPTKDAVHT